MIGDWVYNSKGEKCKVHEVSNIFESNIQLDNYDKENDGCFEMELEVSPIPITNEILKANGWERDGGVSMWHDETFWVSVFHWSKDRLEIVINNTEPHHLLKLDILYVHELQHVLRLCKIDKEIKL